MEKNLEFYDHSDFPDELSPTNRGCSVDVLIYSEKSDEHTIGWFNFNSMSWNFLCREAVGKFQWRPINEQTDKPKKQ